MEYFRSSLKSVLGAPASETQRSSIETVERLVSRVSTSTLLEDRRDACRALRALSKKYRLEVGAQGMDVLKQVLELDRNDCEIIGYSLETLCNITAKQLFEEELALHSEMDSNIGEQFCEVFLKHEENVILVLNFLDEYDFRVRWPAIKLLTSLTACKPKEIQELILVSPMGVSKLMDLLLDNREVIRNDALLLLINLTKSNANIQKIVAFENGFDRLLDVISNEGYSDGGIVVEDCLILMLNLLTNNTSNINFFKEGSYIQKFAPMLSLPENLEEIGWSPQKISNFHCGLQAIRTLVSPNNPAQIITSCQKTLRKAEVLSTLCNILMAVGIPADILTETINTVAEVIRGNLTNQEYFSNVVAPSNPPRQAIIVLIMSMVNEKQPFVLRCAVLYCFQCFLYKNDIAQASVVQNLLPKTVGNTAISAGQLLCSGLFSTDSLSNWFSAVALSHCLEENPAQKEQLLRVMLATNLGAQPVTLLSQCAVFLQHTNKLQAKLGILILLSMWLSHCPAAVKVFLNVPGAMAFLTAQASASEFDNNAELLQGLCAFILGLCVLFNDDSVPNYSKENLAQLVEKRVGIETYCKKLNEISRHELYAKASKQPQIKIKESKDLLLEFEFCKLFKAMEGSIIQALGVQKDLSNGISELSLSEHENALLLQYKNLIRDQDKELQNWQKKYKYLEKECNDLKTELEEVKQTNAQLLDQTTLLKAQISTGAAVITNVIHQVTANTPPPANNEMQPIFVHGNNDALLERIQKLEKDNERLEKVEEELATKTSDLENYQREQDDLVEYLSAQENKIKKLKHKLRQSGLLSASDESGSDLSENEKEQDSGPSLS